MAERMINLPDDVWDKLRDLQQELDEGDITKKGYEKKRSKLLEAYINKDIPSTASTKPNDPIPPANPPSKPQPSKPPPKSSDIRKSSSTNSPKYTRKSSAPYASSSPHNSRRSSRDSPNPSRHSSTPQIPQGVRQEAINLALQKRKEKDGDSIPLPAPTKRQSFVTRRQTDPNVKRNSSYNAHPPTNFKDTPPSSIESLNNVVTSPITVDPPLTSSSSVIRITHDMPMRDPQITVVDGETRIQDFAPPDLMSDIMIQNEINYQKQKQSAKQSGVRLKVPEDQGPSRVSTKIQQLLNTLKRPKKKPMEQFFQDIDDGVEVTLPDPGAPMPEGASSKPAVGEQLLISDRLPNSFLDAVRRYGTSSNKAPAISVVDHHGKIVYTLLYGKLLSRSYRIAYALLHKVGSPKDGTSIMLEDRVGLMYSADDIVGFACAFYGCLFAGVVPVPIYPPIQKEDAGLQQMGFLLNSCGVSWVLTSESCLKNLPKDENGSNVANFKGWPKVHWFHTENLNRPPRDWHPPHLTKDKRMAAYIEHTVAKDGSALGVVVTRDSMFMHTVALTQSCGYTEGEVMISLVDFKKEIGLWHSIFASVLSGVHVVFVPPLVQATISTVWLSLITRMKATCCIVASKDLHWSLHSGREPKDINLLTLRMLLLADRANPWSLSACDSFVNEFEGKGLRKEVVCPCAHSSSGLTIAIRRPGNPGSTATGRGVLSLTGLSHGVVRVDKEGSLTALTLQDCGMVIPGAKVVVVKLEGQPDLCKVDEVGELCVNANSTGISYFGLTGKTNHTFKMQPIDEGRDLPEVYVRSGLLGFLGPGGLVFVTGTTDGLMVVQGRKHNAEDIKATVLAVDPIKYVHRGRIAIFSITVLREERMVIVAEQKSNCSEEESFQWMSHVLPAIDTVHAVGVYCLCLVPPNGLPKFSNGKVCTEESKLKFLEGSLHPVNVLMCPHTTVTNLPKPRTKHQEPGPAAAIVGGLLKGHRMAEAWGRGVADLDDKTDVSKKYQFLSEILKWRAQTSSEQNLFTLLNNKNHVSGTMNCLQLHKKAEKFAIMATEQGKLKSGDHVALLYPPGLDLIAAVYGCLYVGLIPVPVRPPNPNNIATTLPTVKMIIHVSKSVGMMTTAGVIKLIKSKEAAAVVDHKSWPTLVNTDDLPRKKVNLNYRAPTPEMIAYLDFSVSTTGMLAGVKMSHAAMTSLCRAQKLACELYPSREVAICMDPYCGLGFVLWCLSSVYSGHHTILIPPVELETSPSLWLQAISQYKVRDTVCSYPVMELCTKHLSQHINTLKMKHVTLSSLRTCIVVAEERPRIGLIQNFSALFAALGLSTKVVSTSFGSRVNIAICMQEASHPEASTVYIDTRSLRHDRIQELERGAPHSLCLIESGRILPGVIVVIANPETKGLCVDSQLGEIWVSSQHNGSGYFNVTEDDQLTEEHFRARLETNDKETVFARTGYLGFVKRTEITQTDGAPHDALFVVGALDEALLLRGLRYHPIDIEMSLIRGHRSIGECAVFTWTNLLVVVAELEGDEKEALDLVPLITTIVLEEHQVVVGVVVVVDPGTIPLNSRGEKQRMHLRDSFLADQLDPIYVAYNM